MNLATVPRQRPRIFFGWWIVSLAGLVHSINSSAYNKGFVVFLLPVSESLGVSRASISLVFSLSRSEGGPIGPIAGWLIDRFGPRPLIFTGTVITAAGFILLAQTHNIWTFGLVYLALITMGSDLAFSNGLSALINNWFSRRRALAMSTYHAMSSLGPAILVPLLALLIASQGWQTASMVCGFIILGAVLPLCFLVRNTPESAGLLPDGGPAETSSSRGGRRSGKRPPAAASPMNDFSPQEAFRTSSYWLLLAGTWLRLTAKGGVMLHIIPVLVWKGSDQQTAAVIFGLLLFIQVPFSLLFGWLADTLPKNLVLCVTSIAGTAAFGLLASSNSSIWMIYLFVVLFAVAETGGSNNWATVGDYFGRKAYGRLRGLVQLASSPGVFIAPVFAGWWYDRTESYTLPLWVFTGLFALGALAFALTRKPKQVSRPTEKAVSTVGG